MDETDRRDLALIRACAGGDRRAQTELVGRLVPIVRAQLGAMLGRLGGGLGQDLADLQQDVLVELWRNDLQTLLRWDPARGLSLASFVRMVARRQGTRRLLRRHRADAVVAATAPDVLELFAGTKPDGVRDELDELLRAIYSEFGPRDRELFERLFLEQEEAAEAASALGMSVDAVKKWRSRFYDRVARTAARLASNAVPKAVP